MIKYILKRLFISLFVLLGVSIIIYTLVRMMPNDYLDIKFSSQLQQGTITPEQLMDFKNQYGIGDSSFKGLVNGYFQWLGNMLQGDLGLSFKYEKPVAQVIGENMWVSFAIAVIATILQFIGPFFVLGYLTITHKQVMRRLDIIAAICAFLGVFLLSTHGQFDHLAITPAALFWGLLSAVGEAAYTLIPVNIVKKESSMVVTGWGMLFAGLSLVIIQPQFQAIPNKSEVWLYTAAVVIIGTIIPFQIMANALRYVVPSTASLLDAFEPFSATIGSVLVFGLIMMPMDWVGAVLVVVAAMALNIIPKKRSNKIGQNKLSK